MAPARSFTLGDKVVSAEVALNCSETVQYAGTGMSVYDFMELVENMVKTDFKCVIDDNALEPCECMIGCDLHEDGDLWILAFCDKEEEGASDDHHGFWFCMYMDPVHPLEVVSTHCGSSRVLQRNDRIGRAVFGRCFSSS
jgi:hypothetical protein